ncbi:acetate/propionate family kinase [Streptobacillus moniliformis]|uniref:acetate/propionate family kinase n=1 Tax=Streptobacillus moniliformis TaxID=34105 RepID=UPI0007E44EFC|nr:acetate kinase [Streptobacillus moniliformis]
MKILVLNSGSSSLKFSVIDTAVEQIMIKGLCERIGIENSRFSIKNFVKNNNIDKVPELFPNHKRALEFVLNVLVDNEFGVFEDVNQIQAIGHRVVHGGEDFIEPLLINDKNMISLEKISSLAPLHNPANIMGIKVMRELLPKTPNVAVFDTAFHSTMPEKSYMYPIPYEEYEKLKIRKYGFHGTSHKYVSKVAEKLLLEKGVKKPCGGYKIISCHLGNGASITAIKDGKVLDTSMGFTPLAGLMMGTRCGDIDPSIVLHIMDEYNLSVEEMSQKLNKRSGVLGIFGKSSDNRELTEAMLNGDERAKLAFDMMAYSIQKYIGSYYILLQGVDAIIFTGGIGENSSETRQKVCENLEFIGVKLDYEKNKIRQSGDVDLSRLDSETSIFKIATNEELMISIETHNLLKS